MTGLNAQKLDAFADVLRRTSLDATAFANMVLMLSQHALLKGRAVTIDFAATETSRTIPHGLERAVQGSIVTGCSSSAVVPTAATPGTDAVTSVTVYLNTAAPTALSVTLWVY